MNYKYLGEAIALLGIAYSIFRWVARNAAESDRPGPGRIEIDLARLSWPRRSNGERDERVPTGAMRDMMRNPADGEVGATGDQSATRRSPMSTPAPDPGMLEAAALMFGLTPEAIIAMDPRERGLLLSGYRAARTAADRDGRGTQGGA